MTVTLQFTTVTIEKPEDVNVILVQLHFIKTVGGPLRSRRGCSARSTGCTIVLTEGAPHLFEELLCELAELGVDYLQCLFVTVFHGGLELSALAGKRIQRALHQGGVDVVVLEDPDCVICMLDVHVKHLQPVRYVVVPEILF